MTRTPARPLVAGLLAALALLPLTAAAEGIAYVDMERVLQESAQGKAAQERLEKRFGAKQKPFAEEEAAIRQLQQTLARDKPLMSKSQVEKKEQEIKDRIAKFEKDFTEIQKEVMQAQQEEGQKILRPARDAVNRVAKDKKMTVVFEASQAGVMYFDKSADITEAVIKAMGAQAK